MSVITFLYLIWESPLPNKVKQVLSKLTDCVMAFKLLFVRYFNLEPARLMSQKLCFCSSYLFYAYFGQ